MDLFVRNLSILYEANSIVKAGGSSAKFIYLGDSTFVKVESVGVAKVLHSEQNTMEILDSMQWAFRPLKNSKIQTKTHEMDVLEAVEDEPFELHASVRQ